MRLFGKNLDSDVPIIAEIGVNHEGSVDAAIRLLHLAHEAGADRSLVKNGPEEIEYI